MNVDPKTLQLAVASSMMITVALHVIEIVLLKNLICFFSIFVPVKYFLHLIMHVEFSHFENVLV